MKCLSIRQPWASAIILGPKTVENRTWETAYRGDLLIHASRKVDPIPDSFRRQLALDSGLCLQRVTGAILGVVELYDIVPIDDCQLAYACGPWCWMLREPRIFPRFPTWSGQLSLFEVESKVIAALMAEALPPHQWRAKSQLHDPPATTRICGPLD